MSQTNTEALKELDQMEVRIKSIRKMLTRSKPQNITERVKTFEDALPIYVEKYGAISRNMMTILSYSGTDPEMVATCFEKQMEIIIRVLNEGWQSDHTDHNQKKYYPIWDYLTSGLGLSYCGYGDVYSGSTVGSRLHFKDLPTLKYAVEQFLESHYVKFMIKQK